MARQQPPTRGGFRGRNGRPRGVKTTTNGFCRRFQILLVYGLPWILLVSYGYYWYFEPLSSFAQQQQQLLLPQEQGSTNPNEFYHVSLKQFQIPHILIFTHRDNLLLALEQEQKETRQEQKKKKNHELKSVRLSDPSLQPFLDNVLDTIQLYVTAWYKQQQQQQAQPKTTRPRVWFLDNDECRRVIGRVEPRLVPYFDEEPLGKYQGDVCRAAALYLSGGYYMDVDMKTIQPYPTFPRLNHTAINDKPSPIKKKKKKAKKDPSLVLAQSPDGSMFNSFMASAPRHAVLWDSLQIILSYYQKNEQGLFQGYYDYAANEPTVDCDTFSVSSRPSQLEEPSSWFSWSWGTSQPSLKQVARHALCHMAQGLGGSRSKLGPFSLEAALEWHQVVWRQQSQQPHNHNDPLIHVLSEDNFDSAVQQQRQDWYPSLSYQDEGEGCCCNYVVHDRIHHQAYFFSRFVGAGEFCQVAATPSMDDSILKQKTAKMPKQSTTIPSVFGRPLHDVVEFFHITS